MQLSIISRLTETSVQVSGAFSLSSCFESLSSVAEPPGVLVSVSHHRGRTCAFCLGFSTWILSVWVRRCLQAESWRLPGVHLICFPSLGVHCPLLPVAQYLETVVSCVLSSFLAVYGKREGLVLVTPVAFSYDFD